MHGTRCENVHGARVAKGMFTIFPNLVCDLVADYTCDGMKRDLRGLSLKNTLQLQGQKYGSESRHEARAGKHLGFKRMYRNTIIEWFHEVRQAVK